MKILALALTLVLSSTSKSATTVSFSDNVDVVSSPPPISLDSTPYMNTIINQQWLVIANSSSTISNLEITSYIFLFGSGTFEKVTVYGATQSPVSLVANPGTSREQTFPGIPGTTTNEYVFDMNGYNFQPNVTKIAGFSTINTINFMGKYTVIPEPSSLILAGIATATILSRRHRE
jgi:hypothetical protein